ncbi:O-phospho-L-seryl-tRNA:Cys-tRNA synthase [Patescibacteria group bacterium]
MRVDKSLLSRTKEEEFININPIQVGGRLTPEARKALVAYGDGYSVCDYCLSPFRLDYIKKPPVAQFYQELAEFVGMDMVRVMPGARRGFQAVMQSFISKGDTVLVSSLAHYTLILAIEGAGGIWREIPLNKDNIITGKATEEKIKKVKSKTGKFPKLIAIPHFDYQFGNEHDVFEVAKVAQKYEILFLYNGAYSIGILPIDGKKIGADFVVGSGHKSMASPAPTGVLATTDDLAKKLFRTSQTEGDATGRKFGVKEVELLGCTVMGGPLVAMMASFPKVEERVRSWDEEVKKSNYFINQFLRIKGNEVLSEMPRKHTLTKVNTIKSFGKIAKTNKRKGYFLYDALRKRGVIGLFPGATNQWKLNTYGLTWDQVKYLANTFLEIARENGLHVKA